MRGDTLSREELAREIFGESSHIVKGHSAAAEQSADSIGDIVVERTEDIAQIGESLSDNTSLQIITAILLILYLIWLVNFIIHRRRGDYSKERWIYGDNDVRSRADTLKITVSDVMLLCAMIWCVLSTLLPVGCRWVAENYPEVLLRKGVLPAIIDAVERLDILYTSAMMALFAVVTLLWITLIFVVVKMLSQSVVWITLIIKLKSQIALWIVLFFIPFVILFAIYPENQTLCYIVGIEAVVATATYAIATLLLFITQKISILQWFLYLCTVEILPITIIWAILVRSANLL